jgi:hypothetical protein
MSGTPVDLYARVPHRLYRAVTAHELTFNEAGVLQWLVYRCWRDGGETAATLAALHSEMRFPCSSELLRTTLHALVEKGWIEAEAPTPGGRSPWRFTLKDAGVGALGLEVSSKPLSTAGGATAAVKPDSAPTQLQRLPAPKNRGEREISPPPAERDLPLDTERTSTTDSATGGGSADDDRPDININRADACPFCGFLVREDDDAALAEHVESAHPDKVAALDAEARRCHYPRSYEDTHGSSGCWKCERQGHELIWKPSVRYFTLEAAALRDETKASTTVYCACAACHAVADAETEWKKPLRDAEYGAIRARLEAA